MGIGAAITGFIEAIGVGASTAATIASIATPALIGAAGGAGLAAIEGGNIGKGALLGGLTGGIGGAAGDVLTSLGVPAGGLESAAAGAIGGAAGNAITGGNPLTGAIEGGAAGGLFKSFTGPAATPAPAATGGGVSGAAATAAPASVGAVSPDVTQTVAGGTSLPGSGGGGAGLPGSMGAGAAAGGSGGASGLNTTAGDVAGLGSGSSSLTPSTGLSTVNAPTITGAANNPLPVAANDTSSLIQSTPSLKGPSVASSFTDSLTKNPLATAGALGLAGNVLKGNPLPQGFSALNTEASRLAQQGSQMSGYLTNGTLPPGLQAGITAAGDAAAASIRSQYASRGMSGSSAEAQDLQNLQQRLVTQGAEMATQLFSQGVQETQLADQLYLQLMQTQITQNKETGDAIGNFAAALASMGKAA